MYWCLPACTFVYHVCVWCFLSPEGGMRSPGTRITDSCDCHVGGCRNGAMEEQAVFLTTEPPLQPILYYTLHQSLGTTKNPVMGLFITVVF